MTIHGAGRAVVFGIGAFAAWNLFAAESDGGMQAVKTITLGIVISGCIVVAAAFLAAKGFKRGSSRKVRRGRENEYLHAFSGLLSSFAMVPNLEAESSDDAIVKLVHALKEKGKIEKEEEVISAIRQRENSMPTGLDNGLAIPHGRTNAVKGLVGAIATINDPNGIPNYETIDNSPVRIVVLSVSSESEAVTHLHLLSDISRGLRDESSRQRLLSCKDAVEMEKFFSSL